MQWKAIFSIQLFDPSPLAFMATSAFDLHVDAADSRLLLANDRGQVQLLDFNVRNAHNEEMSKVELVRRVWSVEPDQNILHLEVSPFFEEVFLVLTQLVFYLFDRTFDQPLFVSPFSTSPNACCRWSVSR